MDAFPIQHPELAMLKQKVNPSLQLLAGFMAGALLAAGSGSGLAGVLAPAAINLAAQNQSQVQASMEISIAK